MKLLRQVRFATLVILTCASFCVADETLVPGVVIAHSPAKSRQFIGSPGLAVLSGEYVASHDFFGPASGWNRTCVYGSTDRGASWTKRAEIEGQWWSSLFVYQSALYLMGTSREYGFVIIRRSTDGGRSWTNPTDATNGLLLNDARYHCAPVPVVMHGGRIWRAMEDAEGPGGWGTHFRSFMMSAPEGADLLNATSWTCSNRLPRNPAWLEGQFGGWLEGNAVVAPDGNVVNILRVDHKPRGQYAAMIQISESGRQATFDPATGFLDFPGGSKKFTIRFDPESKYYWTLSNIVRGEDAGGPNSAKVRNTLALMRSPDLKRWEIRKVLLHHPDVEKHGFQYVDWLIEGRDLIALSRTAFDDEHGGARNQHDANYLTFHRFPDFRTAN